MDKVTYDYASKRAFRQRLVNFVIRHYTRDERKGLRYLCLPGYDSFNKTSLEIQQVVDPLGIPRENVTGLERSPRIFEKLQKARIGIKLHLTTDNEFFESTKEKFDIVTLDYTGMINEDFRDMMFFHVVGQHILNQPGILATTFYGSRDKRRMEFYGRRATGRAYLDRVVALASAELEEKSDREVEMLNREYLEYEEKAFGEFSQLPFDKMRNEIGPIILMIAANGRRHNLIGTMYAAWSLILELKNKGIEEQVSHFVLRQLSRPYICPDLESYKYVSDDGSPMLSDIFYFEGHPEWFDRKKFPFEFFCPVSCEDFSREKNQLVLCDHVSIRVGKFDLSEPMSYENNFVKKNVKHTHYVEEQMQKSVFGKKREREFLGSSAKPIITGEKAKELLHDGMSSEVILRNFRGVTKQQLAAYMAWNTRKVKNNL